MGTEDIKMGTKNGDGGYLILAGGVIFAAQKLPRAKIKYPPSPFLYPPSPFLPLSCTHETLINNLPAADAVRLPQHPALQPLQRLPYV